MLVNSAFLKYVEFSNNAQNEKFKNCLANTIEAPYIYRQPHKRDISFSKKNETYPFTNMKITKANKKGH